MAWPEGAQTRYHYYLTTRFRENISSPGILGEEPRVLKCANGGAFILLFPAPSKTSGNT